MKFQKIISALLFCLSYSFALFGSNALNCHNHSNSTVEIDTGSGFVSVPFAFGVKSTDLAGQTTLVVFEQSGVSKIRVTLDNPMDAVTVFEVRTFGNAELPERVDYMYDASNRRVARLFTGVANLSIERAVYDGMKVIEERQYTTGQLQRRYYHGDGDNRIIAVEEDADNDGIVDEATDNVYIPLLDDRGTLMGVANKTGFIIEKLYYNSTGLVKSYIWDGSSYVEAVDTNGKNIGRSLFIRSGWTGLYHEPFTQKYHALFRDYDPQHQRWLSEDPAGYVDGMNLYHAYMNVNYIDLMGDNKAVNALLYNLDPTRLVYINKGIMLGLLSNVKGIRDLAGEAFSVVFLNSFEDNAEKFNRAKKTYNYVMANKEQIIRDITKEVIDYSDRYLQAVFEGKDKERLWEEEGKIACEIALMFIGVGEISALAKSSKFLKSVQLLAKAKLDKALKGVSNSNVGKIVEDFLKGSNCLLNSKVCFVAGEI